MAGELWQIEKTIHLSTTISGVCREGDCDEAPQDLDDQINHYISKHQYHLLHVGQETTYGEEGTPWQATVAVLGRE